MTMIKYKDDKITTYTEIRAHEEMDKVNYDEMNLKLMFHLFK